MLEFFMTLVYSILFKQHIYNFFYFPQLISFTSDLNQTTAKLHIIWYYLQLSSPVVIRCMRG